MQAYFILGNGSITLATVSASSEYFFVIIAAIVLLSEFEMIKIYVGESRVHTRECNPFPKVLAGLAFLVWVSAVWAQTEEERKMVMYARTDSKSLLVWCM